MAQPGELDPIRPGRARTVAFAIMWTVLAVFATVAFLLPDVAGGAKWTIGDRIMLFGVGVAVAAVAWRYATICAIPSAHGLVVRNLLFTRRLAWAEIVGVGMRYGDPWLTLDLSDGDSLGVMAVQGSDGEHAQRNAQRLADLVARYGEAREPQ